MMWECILDSAGSKEVPAVGACEHLSEPSGSVKGGEYTE
jgi:hypothetical protein